ncbi:MAG TPA: bifunctional aldolase/short-chain dehydrogenase [Caulobacteraceae bacterium]|nr:bifunctional aldolase/short-chain dehydrogenase [Caulobacteraceae bacterium]
MKSRWDQAEAAAAVARYAKTGVDQDLALRTYSARLLGADRALVLHGGGNTSVKTTTRDLFGQSLEVLCVKGSGWDLASIEPPGHPAVRLSPLLRLRALESLSDEAMVGALRANLIDSTAPNPSVETLLHAFIPAKYIDHSHATAFLALADQPDAEAVIAEALGGRVACVPYVMPGFRLAKAAARLCEQHPAVEGLALLQHGLFTFGATAREAYERMIDLVSLAEAAIARRPRRPAPTPPPGVAPLAQVLPRLRGLLGANPRWILDARTGGSAAALAADPNLAELAQRGVATPDHVIRTKREALVLAPPIGDVDAWAAAAATALRAYEANYRAYFERHAASAPAPKTALDPLPRLIVMPGLGLIAAGRTASEARVAGDIGEVWAETLLAAEAVGRFQPVGEADTFDMEYWSLEQAKLGKRQARRLEGHVVLITGAAGAIGAALARAFAAEGAELALLDLDTEGMAGIAGGGLALAGDARRTEDVEEAFARACQRFGGVDIVISNAGTATAGPMTDLTDAALRDSFDINFFAHQNVARAAVAVFRAQAMGGVLLFNVSKQAINPGPDFGAYGTSKAALLALMRQYALEHGADGVRCNAINPDRIRSGLLTETMIDARAAARGVSRQDYMSGNLLQSEVTAEDVAQAFVFVAMMEKTTGAVIPVDGGNVAAMPR